MDDRSSLSQLLSRARRRCLAHLVFDQSTLAVTIGMAGAILLLLAGTQILDWYWVVLLTAGSLAVGLYRLRQTIPSSYKLAQRIDHKLSLADTLSTATYFSTQGEAAIYQRQRRIAEDLARTVDVRVGVPFVRPRYLYPAIALMAAACGLFALRYAITGNLSLQPSLIRIALDTFFPSKQEAALKTKPGDRLKSLSADPDAPQSPNAESEPPRDSPPDVNDAQDADSQGQDQAKGDPDPNAKDQNDKADNNDDSAGKDGKQDNQQQADNSKNGKDQDGKQDGKQGGEKQESSLMDKLRDAMSNMLSKMKSPKDGQQSANSKSSQQGGQPDKSNPKNGQSEKSQSQDASAQSDQQQGDAADKQSADAGAEKGANNKASQDSKSGIGSADGDKAAKEAAQLAAMGKISEILGKRSANVTGEVMVEVGSSKQQLKTPWAQRQATHTEAGSEIHRDEIPLMYQQFVQQYFEEIRKAPETKPAKAARKTTKPS